MMLKIKIQVLASGSKGNAYILDDGVTKLLLECGIAYNKLLKGINYNFDKVCGCLISHQHADHSLCAESLDKRCINIYTGYGQYNNLMSGKKQTVGSWAVVPFNVPHKNNNGSDCPCLGFVIASKTTGEKIFYATDCMYVPYKLKGYDCLMIECNYQADLLAKNYDKANESLEKRRYLSHMEMGTLIEALNAGDLKKTQQIMLLHPSMDMMDIEFGIKAIKQQTGIPTVFAVGY